MTVHVECYAGYRGDQEPRAFTVGTRRLVVTAVDDRWAGPGHRYFRVRADDGDTYVLWRGEKVFAVLNAYPYTSGHLMVMPYRHVGELDQLDDDEGDELFAAARLAVAAVKRAYDPGGFNLGANLGRAGGAGIPGHLHLHVLPRWNGDTNFMTAVAETRVLPESLATTWQKLSEAWPT